MNDIRMAERGDLEEIMAVLLRCVAGMRDRGIDQWDEIYPSRERFLRDIEAGHLILHCRNREIFGAVALDTDPDPEYATVAWKYAGKNAGIVHRLMVSPDYQGQGLAGEIMRAVEVEAKKRAYRSLRLDAFTLNPQALRLYRGLGYQEVGQIRLRKGIFQCFEKELPA